MVFCYREVVTRPRISEGIQPFVSIELLGCKERDKALIAMLSVRSESVNLMFELISALDVEVARIPFVGKFRNSVESSVSEDAELVAAKPCRSR